MRGGSAAFTLLIGLSFVLTGCNSTDALIPPVDIGTTQSTPLTQQDLDRASANADQYAQRQQRQQIPPAQNNGYQPSYNPQHTLDAQAQALNSGQQPQQLSTRLYQQPAAGSEPSQNRMLPAPVQQDSAQQSASLVDEPPEQAAVAQAPEQQASVAIQGKPGTVRFLPIIGAPVAAVTPLSRELGNAARSSGLTILPSADQSAGNILKGYLSAFEDGSNVNIIYVWDVLDASGNRLHRLQGQESAPKQGSDPWAAATPTIMQEIARKTISDYSKWKADHNN